MNGEMMTGDFWGGVVEGFYGQPWTMLQRLQLFDQMATWGLNTYFYAPKDDLKHRALWRTPYDFDEMSRLAELISSCQSRGLRFVYGLSPGLDIRFSDPVDIGIVKSRLAQLMEVGGLNFALLFDDLPGNMNDADRQAFSSVAAAQCSVTNDAYQWLRQQCPHGRMLFCPTPYCDRMVRWGLGGADYLDIVGESLHPSIEVFWTGPEIISRTISVDSIARLTERIRRPPVIWDNLHANDYDMRRLYCGPYSGREVELKRHVRGIISNPNCEFPINYVPLRTLADYLSTDEYDPSESYLAAIDSWSECFGTIGEPVRRVDVQFLADCFYLPFDQGESARELYERVANLVSQPVSNWGNRDQFVYDLNQRMRSLSDQLTQLRDRELFYAWSRRAWELREELELISDFLQKKRAGLDEAGAIRTEKHLPHTYRGGTVAQLQTLLTPDGSGRIRAADCMNWTK